jgi:G3E family GTPase
MSKISSSYAVGRLPRFSGRARSFVENYLRSQGFRPTLADKGSVTWVHSDGSRVRIDPAHRPGSPAANPKVSGNILSHERAHYHKIWSDGYNLLTLDDRAYVVDSKSANAHIVSKRSKNKRHLGYAIDKLPRFSGRPRSFVENRLRSQGFNPTPPVKGSVTWVHSDGSRVRIDPMHRLGSPAINPNVPRHERANYHKIWSDGRIWKIFDDRGFIVSSRSQGQREAEFLFEALY